MPRLNRRRRRRNRLELDDLHLSDICNLTICWAEFCKGSHFQTLDDLRQCYEDHRDELTAMQHEPSDATAAYGHHPGDRHFAEWKFDLLPVEPRRLVLNLPDYEPTSTREPHGRCWETDGYESSYDYLERRDLLKPDEIELIAKWWSSSIETSLRITRGGSIHCRTVHSVELVTLRKIVPDLVAAHERAMAAD